MRYAIVGSRDYHDLEEVREFVRGLPSDAVIVTGGARGVDKTAEDEARKCNLELVVHRAEWEKYGKSAGPIRNRRVVEDCDKLVAFWDGSSPGTGHVIGLASKAGKLLRVSNSKKKNQMSLF